MKLCFFPLAVALGLCAGTKASAQRVETTLQEYKHTRWGPDENAPNRIHDIAQDLDGYLWLAASSGLYRFDGITFERISPDPVRTQSDTPTALLASREGDLWVGYAAGGTAVYRHGRLTERSMPQNAVVMALAQTRSGTIWAALGGVKRQQLARFIAGRWATVGSDWGFPEEHLISLLAARDGTLWVATAKSLLILPDRSKHFMRSAVIPVGHAALSQDASGRVWISDSAGSRVIANGARQFRGGARSYPSPGSQRQIGAFFDRAGNLWGHGRVGIYRVLRPDPAGPQSAAAGQRQVLRYLQRDGLSADSVGALFEDREGNIWVGTNLGLDRLRRVPVIVDPTLTHVAKWGDILLGASDGSVYVGEADGVYRVKPGGRPDLLLKHSEPQALCEGPDGAIWAVLQKAVVTIRNGRISRTLGLREADQGIADCAVDRSGALWLAALRDGMFKYANGTWQTLLVPPAEGGHPPATVLRLRNGKTLVALDDGGLFALDALKQPVGPIPGTGKMGRIRTLYEGQEGLLLAGSLGLTRLHGPHIDRVPSTALLPIKGASGIVQTPGGETWLNGPAGLVRLRSKDLSAAFDGILAAPVATVLDYRDGLPGAPTGDSVRDVVRGGDGRLWFSTTAGTVWVDPSSLSRNRSVPPITISAVRASGRSYRDPHKVSLVAGTSSVEIAFSVLSLSVPERVRVRYRLEGVDGHWIDPGMRRQAFYTNLGPGHYLFKVIGSNNDGVWNRNGATLELNIPPTFLQSRTFLAICLLGMLCSLWLLYSMRLRQVTAQMRGRLEERMAERERIARDLHDTLLQGFQGLILRFQSVANAIPTDQRAHFLIEEALESADEVLNEGRESVGQLRSVRDEELSQKLAETADRLSQDHPADFRMVVEGATRVLHPIIGEEVRRIAEEALINAFRHARASMIEIVVSYHPSALLLGVRDDGVGIDPLILEDGARQGHFGLVGMRERAREIGADLKINSRAESGTEILLHLPGGLAYLQRRKPLRPLISHLKRLRGRLDNDR